MQRVFTLYGHFTWPGQPATPGVVEIWLDRLCPILRWCPRARVDTAGDPASDPIPEGTTAPAFFSANPGEDRVAALEDIAAAGGIAFAGGSLLEQYDLGDVDLRLPLATGIDYGGAGSAAFSGLRVFTAGLEARFALHLHLPLPVAHAVSSPVPAFPLVAEYLVRPAGPLDAPPIIATLRGGWSGPDGTGGTATELDFRHLAVDTWRLGGFGLSERGGPAEPGFVVYAQTAGTTGRYWPRNADTFLDLCRRYGFDVGTGTGWLIYTNGSPTDLSLRFEAESEHAPARVRTLTRLIYRVRTRKQASPPDGVDLGTDGTRFRIRLAAELGGWLHLGTSDPKPGADASIDNDLSADCTLAWTISPHAAWSRDPGTDWSPTVTIRLHWAERVVKIDPALVQPDQRFSGGLLAFAAGTFPAVRAALPAGEAGDPVSFLPSLALEEGRTVRFVLHGTPLPATMDPETHLVAWGSRDPAGRPRPWRRPPMRLTLARFEDLIDRTPEAAVLPALPLVATGIAGSDQARRLTFDLLGDPLARGTDPGGFFASFALSLTGRVEPWKSCLGSLGFELSKPYPEPGQTPAAQEGFLRIGGKGRDDGFGDALPIRYPGGRIAAAIRIPLPATAVIPGGIDVPRFDRTGRPAPLLIEISPPGKDDGPAGTTPYWLIATETILPREDRHLTAEIRDTAAGTGPRAYAVLSTQPFAVFRFSHKPLSDRGTETSTSVATYDGDTRIWQYAVVSPLYRYTLPPQAIGESADKPGRLELHDIPDEAPAPGTPWRPFVPDDWTTPGGPDGKRPESGLRRRAVEYRLTPAAEIWIRPSDVARGYFMPEASSHDIFRQSGAYGIGAALAFLRAEFLYGLPVGIDVARERSAARGARVAEIEALVGRPTDRAPDTIAEPALAARWTALRAAIARRPERLEIWARDFDGAVDFTPARFTDSVRFALRGTALHRAPVIDAGAEDADGHAAWPTTGPDRDPATTSAVPNRPRIHPQGLSGGALWPVESLALLNVLLDAPQSRGGIIENIALSPTGGDASQKAEFLDGRVTVISETRNGRVQRQQVEVLGRIAALWHRAKHVVVYERTVNPSAQFAPRAEDDPHHTRSRRPILRKVREYIELLQPERSYPDVPAAAARSAGFLDRVRFNARTVNVDSAWASDLGTVGWQVPLWNRHAARERPQVYPMPDIAFVTVAEGDGDRPVVAQETRDPDYLFFFADFQTATSDTDQWVPRPAIDFPNVPDPEALRQAAEPDPDLPPGGTDPRRPPVDRIMPGMRRFTWRLMPGAQKTAINAGRAGKPIYVGLESVSFMRASHATVPDAVDRHAPLTEALAYSRGKIRAGGLSALGHWPRPEGKASPPPRAATLATAIETFKAAIRSGSDIAVPRAAFQQAWTGFARDMAAAAAGSAFPPLALASLPADPVSLCARLKDDAAGLIRRKEMLARSALSDWAAETDRLLASLEPMDKAVLAKTWTDQAVLRIRPLFEQATQDVAQAGETVERAQAILADTEADLDTLFAALRHRVQQVRDGYDKSKPWSEERRRAMRASVQATIAGIAAELGAVVDEAGQRLATELGDLGQAIAGQVAQALRGIQLDIVPATIASFATVFDTVTRTFDAQLQALLAADSTLTALEKGIEGNAQLTPGQKAALSKTVQAARTTVTDARRALSALREEWDDVNLLAKDRADAAIAVLIGEMKRQEDAVRRVIAAIAADIAQLTDPAFDALRTAATAIEAATNAAANDLLAGIDTRLTTIDADADAIVGPAFAWIEEQAKRTRPILLQAAHILAALAADLSGGIDTLRKDLAPGALFERCVAKLVAAAIDTALQPLPATIDPAEDLAPLRERLHMVVDEIGTRMRTFSTAALDTVSDVSDLCKQLASGVGQAYALLKDLEKGAAAYLDKKLGEIDATLQAVLGTTKEVEALVAALDRLDQDTRAVFNDVARAAETARAFGDRVADAASRLGEGGLMAAPSNILKLYAAVTTAPELGALKSDIDRIRATFAEAEDLIRTTRATALFNRFGDALKAIGLSIPYDGFGDRLKVANITGFDVGQCFRNIGGVKFDHLLRACRIGAGVADAIKITHDFDPAHGRAWVQIDIDAPFPGRQSLFSIGVFQVDFVDMTLTGRLRLEASKDDPTVTSTGFGRIAATLDAVVSGQSMVAFENFGISFTSEHGIDVEFDPTRVRLNQQFKWIQDFLSTMVPDLPGGLEWIKQNGMPVGVQHAIELPPFALTFGTSGVSNISLGNHFKLVAFPEFLISNRFNLSSLERPFIFSIFILGGTGYLQIESEYNPIRDQLSVLVEAGAGASAQLAFAAGPFVGQVYITLSGSLSYRKLINEPGGSLSIAMVLVIAGHVVVCGIVTCGITLNLRLSYRDTGQIDADGSLSVSIRISRFFVLKARGHANYMVRGGQSRLTTDGTIKGEPSPEMQKKIDKVKSAADTLQKAVG